MYHRGNPETRIPQPGIPESFSPQGSSELRLLVGPERYEKLLFDEQIVPSGSILLLFATTPTTLYLHNQSSYLPHT